MTLGILLSYAAWFVFSRTIYGIAEYKIRGDYEVEPLNLSCGSPILGDLLLLFGLPCLCIYLCVDAYKSWSIKSKAKLKCQVSLLQKEVNTLKTQLKVGEYSHQLLLEEKQRLAAEQEVETHLGKLP